MAGDISSIWFWELFFTEWESNVSKLLIVIILEFLSITYNLFYTISVYYLEDSLIFCLLETGSIISSLMKISYIWFVSSFCLIYASFCQELILSSSLSLIRSLPSSVTQFEVVNFDITVVISFYTKFEYLHIDINCSSGFFFFLYSFISSLFWIWCSSIISSSLIST